MNKLISDSKKILIKIGSSVLSNEDGHVNKDFVKDIVAQIVELKKQGKQVILVSSGAGICGVGAINKWSRRGDMNYKQALCSIGQVELMLEYKNYFLESDIHVGQILLSKEDFLNPTRNLNIRNTLFTLLDENVIPIINENDTVSTDEIKIGDNDMLAAYTACLWNADLLILLSDIDGVFNEPPKNNSNAKLIKRVYNIDELEDNIKISGTSEFGTGGLKTKLDAARRVKEYNIPTLLLNGKLERVILKAQENEVAGTAFMPEES